MEGSEHNYVDLAVAEVYSTDSRYVVACPAWRATVGGLVEFETDGGRSLGRIVDRITVERDGEVWRFLSQMAGIIPCAGVWESCGGMK